MEVYAQYSTKGCFPQKQRAVSPVLLPGEAELALDSEATLERIGTGIRVRMEAARSAKLPAAIGMARQVSV